MIFECYKIKIDVSIFPLIDEWVKRLRVVLLFETEPPLGDFFFIATMRTTQTIKVHEWLLGMASLGWQFTEVQMWFNTDVSEDLPDYMNFLFFVCGDEKGTHTSTTTALAESQTKATWHVSAPHAISGQQLVGQACTNPLLQELASTSSWQGKGQCTFTWTTTPKDAATCVCAHDKFLALGTRAGAVHVLDVGGNEIRALNPHSAAVHGTTARLVPRAASALNTRRL